MCDCEALDCRAWDVKEMDGQQKLEFIGAKKDILSALGELSEGLFASVCAKVHVYECVVSVVCCCCVCVPGKSINYKDLFAGIHMFYEANGLHCHQYKTSEVFCMFNVSCIADVLLCCCVVVIMLLLLYELRSWICWPPSTHK